jgi:hypothetical protein
MGSSEGFLSLIRQKSVYGNNRPRKMVNSYEKD